jgi:hypothetical protein
MAKTWFRFHRDALHSVKVQCLKPEIFRAWVNILCATDDDGVIPNINSLSFLLREKVEKVATYLVVLQRAGLIDKTENGLKPHNWDDRQFKSDVSTDRVKRFRERSKERCETVPETPSDTETYTEHNRTEEVREAKRKRSPSTKGTRWPSEAVVPDDWKAEAEEARARHQLPPLDATLMAERFANYWASSGTAKRDWKRTWINWALSEKGPRHGAGSGRKSQLEQLADIVAGERPGEVIEG